MSDTPRTDAYAAKGKEYAQQEVVFASFSRHLERENAALLEDKAHLREELREANRLLVAFGPESARAARAAEKTPVGADAIMRQHLHEGGTPT